MKPIYNIALLLTLYLLLGSSQCTEVTISTRVDSAAKVSAQHGNFNGGLDSGDNFGAALADIGDLEGDGVRDLAVGAPGDDTNGDNRGAVWVLFMNSDGSVDISSKIAQNVNGFTGNLDNDDRFGSAVAGIGDLNGDGFRDLAVGAPLDDDGGDDRGAVWILFMNADGTVAGNAKISDQQGGFSGDLDDGDQFGAAVSALGDLDGDGIGDLAVGAPLAQDNGVIKGTVWILFMNADGTVRSTARIADGKGDFSDSVFADDRFGGALAGIGDLDGDGIPDLAVGADQRDAGGSDRGTVWILFLNRNGTVREQMRIASNTGGFEGELADGDRFGSSIARVGDFNDDGIDDLAVGAAGDDDGGTDRGAVWILFLKTTGKVKGEAKISSTEGKFDRDLDDGDNFGASLAGLGNFNNDQLDDIAVGAPLDDDDETDAGAFYILFMERHEDEKRVTLFSSN